MTDRDPSRPHPRVDLDDTLDDTSPGGRRRTRTPLAVPRAVTPEDAVLAAAVARIRAADPQWEIGDAVADAFARLEERIAEVAALPSEGRLVALEAWRRRLTGEADSNGRLGNMDRTIAKDREERARADDEIVERIDALRVDVGTPEQLRDRWSTVRAVKWTSVKILGLLAAAAITAGGGVWAQIKARDDRVVHASKLEAQVQQNTLLIRAALRKLGFDLDTGEPP